MTTVDVDKLRDEMLHRVEDMYNQDHFFVESCYQGDKFSKRVSLLDKELRMFFEENNYIITEGRKCIYITDTNVKRRIKVEPLPI